MTQEVLFPVPAPEDSSTVRFELVDPAANRFRWYELEQRGATTVIRRWGRLGKHGRRQVDICENAEEAKHLMEDLTRSRKRHGYRQVIFSTGQLSLFDANAFDRV